MHANIENNKQEPAHSNSDLLEPPDQQQIQEWLFGRLAELLGANVKSVDAATPFDRLGVDSSVAIGLTGQLEKWLGRDLDPTLLYDYPTIATLAKHLAEPPSER
jgi:acyl carrier protein